jgi:hypothetical protein
MRKIAQNLLKASRYLEFIIQKPIFKLFIIDAWSGNRAGPKLGEAAAKGRAREEV